jgi:hypothetical protein
MIRKILNKFGYYHREEVIKILIDHRDDLKKTPPISGIKDIDDLSESDRRWWFAQRKMLDDKADVLENMIYIFGYKGLVKDNRK